MNKLKKNILLAASLVAITSCGSKKEEASTPAINQTYKSYSFSSTVGGEEVLSKKCSTGKVSSKTAIEYCRNLANDKLNNDCAEAERQKAYESEGCGILVKKVLPSISHDFDIRLGDDTFHASTPFPQGPAEPFLKQDDFLFSMTSNNNEIGFKEMQKRITKTNTHQFDYSDLPLNGLTMYELKEKKQGTFVQVGLSSNHDAYISGSFFGGKSEARLSADITNYNWKYFTKTTGRQAKRYELSCTGKLLLLDKVLTEVDTVEQFRWKADWQDKKKVTPFEEVKEQYEVPISIDIKVAGSHSGPSKQIEFEVNINETDLNFTVRSEYSRYLLLSYKLSSEEDAGYDQIDLECEVHPFK